MVPAARLELARPYERQILSLLCLPFHQAGPLVFATFFRAFGQDPCEIFLTFHCFSTKNLVFNALLILLTYLKE